MQFNRMSRSCSVALNFWLMSDIISGDSIDYKVFSKSALILSIARLDSSPVNSGIFNTIPST